MKLQPGTTIGPYEIVALLGAGGMGEVYRAKDPRLGREVAIKVLPAEYSSDSDRLRRFEQEAKAAGLLNHPNILSVFDIGTHEGCAYVVSELLVGETLRERLGGTALSTRKLIEFGLQIAHGLAAAHDKGIIHRDLKPENIFITRDGRVKILDFGLAKLTIPEPVSGGKSQLATKDAGTQPGMVLGTVGYMSPEQVRGQEVDHRSDLFSFGAILYEMATGKRAFHRDSTADTMSAILKEDPVDPSSTQKSFPAPLERIIRHCLEKNAEERFQSARDLAFDLEMLSGASGTAFTEQAPIAKATGFKRSTLLVPILLLAGILLGGAFTYWMLREKMQTVAPTFQRLTFSRGYVSAARFAPDHQTILFSSVWSGKPVEIFSTRPQSPVSRALGVNADLLSISSNGEMAILLDPVFISGWFRGGTLARVPIDGGGPRQVLDNVGDADWSLDGSQLAVIRNTPTKRRIELPVGKVIYETDGWMSHIRFSRDGKQLAFLEHPQLGDDRGFVVVMDLEGKKKVLTKEFASESGLAWSPKGEEIWFSASQGGSNLSPLRAVTLDGKERIIASMAGNLTLQDVSPTGETLVLEDNRRREMIAYMPGDSVERDLSWMDWTFPRDLSSDGKLVLFEEQGAGGGQDYSVYIHKTDGSAAVRLGDGYAVALSPDGQTALSSLPSSASTVFLLPTGAGQPKKLNFDFYTRAFLTATWMPDGKSLIIRCSKTSSDQGRSWLYDIETGQARPITPEGIQPSVLSIDGKFLVAKCIDGGDCIYKIPTGEAEKITGLQPQDNVIGASTDPKWFYVGSQPAALTKKYEVVNIFTGERKPWKQITPPDTSGVVPPITIKITPDGTSYVYTYRRVLADLYLAKGLK